MKYLKEFKDLFKKKPAIEKVDLTRRFEFIARVGQGSMSKVWRVRDAMTGKTMALKVLDREKTLRFEARFSGLDKPSEGEISLHLRHPNIVQTFEHGVTTEDQQFLLMEFVQGVGLSYLVDVQNAVMQKNRMRFMLQLGEAINYFHKQNWIHRDICPRNVLLSEDLQVKLIDFGLVVPNTKDFRRPGNRTGTASYMAPELIKRQWTDQRIDLFSFGITCFEMFTNQFPWEVGDSVTLEMAVQHINNPPNDIRDLVPSIDEQLADTIMKAMAPRPDDRWTTISEMLVHLREAAKRIDPQNADDDDDEWELVG